MWPLRKLFLALAFVMSLALPAHDTYAAPNLLLQCLAKEETQLHKEKSQGSLYHLNQEFLNELASSNDIALKKNFVDEVCDNHKKSVMHSPSAGLLRLLLLKESDIYDLSLSEVESTMRPFKMAYINEFQKQVPRLFVQFISGLQAEMPTSDCLSKAIPELAFFNERLKYLEEEVSIHDVMKDKKKIEAVFTKLESLPKIKLGCLQEARRMKKK
jgi:hypothetical protein